MSESTEIYIEDGVIPDDQIPSIDENSPETGDDSSTNQDEILIKLSNELNRIDAELNNLQSSFDLIKNNSSIKDIIIKNPTTGEVTSDYILSLLSSIGTDGLYVFINNTDYSLERFITATSTPNTKKGVEGLLVKEGNYIYIYYLNEVTYTLEITPSSSTIDPNTNETITIDPVYKWSKKENLNYINSTDTNGNLLLQVPGGVTSAEVGVDGFVKSDIIKGIIRVIDVGKDSWSQYIKDTYGEGTGVSLSAVPQDLTVKQVNPLEIGSGNTSKPYIQTGLYLFLNESKFSVIASEGDNPYKDVYGFASVTTPQNGDYKQYIYYPNHATYWRERINTTTMWQDFNKMLIKNQVYQTIWHETSNMNNITDSGIHICSNGMRYSSGDNLPITEITQGATKANFSFILNVSNSIYTNEEGVSYTIIGQTLQLSNRIGGETKVFTRSYNSKSDENSSWTNWKELKGTSILNEISDSDLKNIEDNGTYEGVINNGDIETFANNIEQNISTFIQSAIGYGHSQIPFDGGVVRLLTGSLFTLDVKNNYTVVEFANKNGISIPKSITQTAKIQLIDGTPMELSRIKRENLNNGNWTNWYINIAFQTMLEDFNQTAN